MQKRKGFTLVELVIVIAVIAILAGVLIGTFASVINRANDSAKLQELKAQEIEQKANDIIKKIEESDWFGWEDFEASVVDKLTKAYKANGTTVDTAKLAIELKEAIEEYAKAAAGNNTSLTEAQVKVIVENALGTIKFEGVTEAQVKAAIDAATKDVKSSQLTSAQVKEVVEAVNAKGLTANQVATLLADALKNVTTKEELNTALAGLHGQITNNVEAKLLTRADIEDILKSYLPVTEEVNVDNASTLSDVASKLVTGSRIILTGDWSQTEAVLEFEAEKTLTLSGSKVQKLTINAPAATIFLYNDGKLLDAKAVAMSSLHIYGEWKNDNNEAAVQFSQGRLVVEASGVVEKLAIAPSVEASVKVLVKEEAKVEEVDIDASSGTSVDFSNEGTVANVEINGTTTPVNIDGVDATNVEGNDNPNVVVNGEGAVELTQEKLDSLYSSDRYILNDVAYKVVEDLNLVGFIQSSPNCVINLNGHNMRGNSYLFYVFSGRELTIKGEGNLITNGQVAVNVAGTLVLNDATINGPSYGVFVRSSSTKGGTFILNSGKVQANDYGVCLWGDTNGGKTTFVMNGGVIESNGFAVTGSGNDQVYGSTWTINGGKLISKNTNVVYHPNLGTFTINGGSLETEVSGVSGMEFKAGTLVINGGTFRTTGESDEGAYIYGNGSSNIPAVIAIVKHASYAGKINVTINAGTFTTPYKYVVGIFEESEESVYSSNNTVLGKKPILGIVDDTLNNKGNKIVESFVINGGVFSNDVSVYVATNKTYNPGTGKVE